MTDQTNWMLDEEIEAFNKQFNYGKNIEIIKEATIRKIEYGRICLSQFFTEIMADCKSAHSIYSKMDGELKKRIIELGATPKNILF